MSDGLHPVTVRITEIAWRALQARERVDGIACATRLAAMAEELAEREIHAAKVIVRALEVEQLMETASKLGDA